MGRKAIEMVGRTFGTLRVDGEVPGAAKSKAFEVVCVACGARSTRLGGNIRRAANAGATGCECGNRSRKHGLYKHPGYKTWDGMIARCYNRDHDAFHRYGGRGIGVCDEWRASPAAFCEWLEAKGWRRGLQVDRRDNDAGYSPENCRLVPPIENANNKACNRTLIIDGEALTVAQASRRWGIGKTTIKERLNRGWSDAEAVRRV